MLLAIIAPVFLSSSTDLALYFSNLPTFLSSSVLFLPTPFLFSNSVLVNKVCSLASPFGFHLIPVLGASASILSIPKLPFGPCMCLSWIKSSVSFKNL